MEKYDKIELDIMKVLDRVALEGDEKKINGDRQWTYRIKELICELGTDSGFEVRCSGFTDKFNNEWLYDIVWSRYNDLKRLETIGLVVESEWGRNLYQIKYDFEKLLVANSQNRLFICQAKQHQFDEFCNYFKDAIANYNQLRVGDRFLIAILDDYWSGDFKYELIVKQ
ncbi:MAG: hypothetical protein WCK02_01965 [Bacteroidota bacterium]